MRGTLTGDFDALLQFGNKAVRMGSAASMARISKELADEALFQVQVGFSREQDPYGRPWFPKEYPDGRKILRNKGRLEKSWYRKYSGADSFIIGSRAPYSIFAQSGTGIYGPSRQPIRPKRGKALRFRGPGGKFIFRTQVDGSRQRLMVPVAGRTSVMWTRAFKQRAVAYLANRFQKAA